MGKFKSKTTLKIVSATSVTIFSLLTVFVATWAWFAMNQNVDGSGLNVKVSRMDGRLKNVFFYSFNDPAPNDETFIFDSTPFASYHYDWDEKEIAIDDDEFANWNMGAYSSDFKNHPLLIVFEFDREYTSSYAGDMYVKGKTTVGGNSLTYAYAEADTNHENPLYTTNGGGFLGARKSTGEPYYSLPQTTVNSEEHPESILMKKSSGALNDYEYYALSSVAAFRNRTFTGTEFTTFSSGATLSFPTSTLETDEAFTTIDNNAETYLFRQNPYLFKSNGSGSIKYIALIVEYSSDAIGYIYSTYLGDSGLNNYDSVLHFMCDWSFEVF